MQGASTDWMRDKMVVDSLRPFEETRRYETMPGWSVVDSCWSDDGYRIKSYVAVHKDGKFSHASSWTGTYRTPPEHLREF